jgi:hypothetical protein
MCFRYCRPAKHPAFEHAQCSIREFQLPEFRTRFHRKTSTECWSLAASDFAPGPDGTLESCSEQSSAKRAFITCCIDEGQSHVCGVVS